MQVVQLPVGPVRLDYQPRDGAFVNFVIEVESDPEDMVARALNAAVASAEHDGVSSRWIERPFDKFLRGHLSTPQRHHLASVKAELGIETNIFPDRIWVNSRYEVWVYKDGSWDDKNPLLWLQIKRFDKAPIHDWREFQRIKTALCGENAEAFELYPSEDRVVDTANSYHLFVARPGVRIPAGFREGLRDNGDNPWFTAIAPNARQRRI